MFLNKDFLNLYEEFSEINESKADTLKLVNFAGEDLANRFLAVKNRLTAPENDLYYWIKNKTPEELESAISSLENTRTKTQVKKELSEVGAELVDETEHWKVYHITTFEAAQKYGRDTKWCITGIDGYGDKYWKEYTEDAGVNFYFLITKGAYDPRGTDSKFALALYSHELGEVFNHLFTIRTALAATLVMAFFCALLLTTGRVSGLGKRIVLSVAALGFVIVMIFTSTSIGDDVKQMWNTRGSTQQSNMEWRTTRDNGNKFAKYASATVFAPMIFTIPFPTMTETPHQENQKMIHGGNFVKNILSYFTIMALFVLLFSGNWRKHVLPLAVLCGYLVVLVFSNFAQSERFHLPILPLTMMFAALGISLMKENPWIKRYFNYWCVLMFLAAIAWNWFKLAGRGMI